MMECFRNQMMDASHRALAGGSDDRFRAQLSRLGHPGFAYFPKPDQRTLPDTLLMDILSTRDVDARVVEALPWLAATFQHRMEFRWMALQAQLQNLQNRLGFVLQIAGVSTPEGLLAIRELDRVRLTREDTLCWASMPGPTREWIRANRCALAEHWDLLTRLGASGDC